MTVQVPKNAMDALKEFILKHDTVTEQEYWEREAVNWIIADIDCICSELDEYPEPILEHYGLLKHYDHKTLRGEQRAKELLKKYEKAKTKQAGLTFADFLDIVQRG